MADDLELEAGGGKKGGAMKLIIIAVLLIVLLGGGAVALRILAPGLIPGWGEKPQDQPADAAPGPKEADPGLGELYAMKSFIVNLVDPTGKRYLKITMSLELSVPELKAEVDARLPQIQDAILVLLSSKTFGDISTPAGKSQLRTEIINRCNAYLKTGQIKNVYFSEFVVQ